MYCASGGDRRICCNVTGAKIDQSIWSIWFSFKINLKLRQITNSTKALNGFICMGTKIKQISCRQIFAGLPINREIPKNQYTKKIKSQKLISGWINIRFSGFKSRSREFVLLPGNEFWGLNKPKDRNRSFHD